jgi:hypothetical protein
MGLTQVSTSIDLAVAWATHWEGLKKILTLAQLGRVRVRILVGLGGYLTDPKHLELMAQHTELRIYGGPTGNLFHTKLYLFRNSDSCIC